jgi:hypothetical protein
MESGMVPIPMAMAAIALIAGSMTLGVVLSRATLTMVFRIAEYTRAFVSR